ncbi:MAG: OmpA family protein [Pseudomonadota bacterium]
MSGSGAFACPELPELRPRAASGEAAGTGLLVTFVRGLAASALLLAAPQAIAANPGAVVSNQAVLAYESTPGVSQTLASNVVELTVAVTRSPASVALTRVLVSGGEFQETVGPSACLQSGSFVDLANPTLLGGTPIDPTLPQQVAQAASYNQGEPVFIRLADADQNVDFQAVDYVTVAVENATTGDSEQLRLSETGLNTGVFAGFIPTSGAQTQPADCVLQVAPKSNVTVRYEDPLDNTDSATASSVFDPTQRVFETRTGTLVSGATIELVDAATGLPATVLGNDGVSEFPSAITSGGTVTDSGGTLYVFAPGEYRFPVVPDGDYRLLVTPPAAYAAPSQVAETELQGLPGAPFAIGPGSFAIEFSKAGGLSVAFDIPVDPQSTALFMQKRTLTTTAAPGDFVRYELTLENASASAGANDIRVLDQLPPGVRFVPGSVTVNDSSAPDPAFNADRTTLEFRFPSLGIAERLSIFYVVEVVGGKANSELVNRATAFAAAGLISNEATASIQLTEDLFRSTSTLIGRVLEGDCSQQTFGEDQGVAGVRIYLEDGRYAVSDEGGRFHFEGLAPGTHVAQLDTFSLPDWFDVAGCGDDPDFAGRGDSQFVKLGRGTLQRADFYLRRKEAPEGRLELELANSGTGNADEVRYTLTLNGVGNVAIRNIDVTVMLPGGVAYRRGSMRVDGANLGDPRVSGEALSLALPDKHGNWTGKLEFTGSIDDKVAGELTTRAVATFDTPIEARQKTPVGETLMRREPGRVENAGYVLDLKFGVLSDRLSESDLKLLDELVQNWRGVRDVRISAVGHSDSQRISARNQSVFADNYALSRARAASAAAYLADALDVALDNIEVAGRGPDDPVADNGSAAGRQKNRRVELIMSGIRPTAPSFLEVKKASSGSQAIATRGAIPGTELAQSQEPALTATEAQEEPPFSSLAPGVALLLPTERFEPAVPSLPISVQHAPSQSVEVWLNGLPVNPLTFDSSETSADGRIAVSRWRGVNLDDGENELKVVVMSADGRAAKTLIRSVYYGGAPVRGELVAAESTLIADGKTQPVLAIRLYDRAGRPSRPGVVGEFSVESPFRSQWEVDNDRQNQLVQVGDRRPTYKVGADGIALIELEPTTRTGEVTVSLAFENYRDQSLRAWLEPAARDWILVGFAEGTAGYNTLQDNLVAAEDAGFEDGYYDDGRTAFFAKGRIRGDYLLTLSYDSDRERSDTQNRFETEVDPTAYYPLYADTTEQRFEAASQRKLYVKLERSQFYALFGDYAAGLTVAELARYDRRFNGLKSEYRGETVSYNVFAAETNQAFNRDELRGDGTSGLYRLSRAPVIANSELVRIETRDRFDSGVVLSSRNLTRFLDYNLDTLNGTLFFKEPVPSRDLEFNPVYIVVEYETASSAEEDLIAGGRAAVHLADDAVEVGVSFVDDQTEGAEADLSGVDLRWQVNSQTEVRAEYARTTSTDISGAQVEGNAHSVSIQHNGETVDLRAFVREVENDFGVGYQAAADSGFRRLGVDLRAKLSERFFLEGEAGWQQNLETEDIRNLANARLRYERQGFTSSLGLSHAEDKFDDGETRSSDLAELAVSQRLFGERVTLRASASTALGDEAESVDFPTRFVVGTDYRIRPGVDLVAEYEDASGRDIDATMGRLGIRATPFARTQINSFLNNEVSEFGPRLFANLGLVQGFRLSERWTLDVGVDQTRTLRDVNERIFDTDRELVSGSQNEDFLSVFAGALYNAELWSANTRVEVRDSDSEERTSLSFGWYREPLRGIGLSAGLLVYRSELAMGNEITAADLKFGWAYRPADRRWALLNRVDLIFEDRLQNGTAEDSWRVINNLVANRRFGAASELSLQYAFKYVRSNFSGLEISGYSDLLGVDYRRGIRGRFDVGVNASVYNSYQSSVSDYGLGLDIGYNVATNIWVTLGYNFSGFYDQDFVEARYTAAGPFLRFSLKADQRTLKAIAGR